MGIVDRLLIDEVVDDKLDSNEGVLRELLIGEDEDGVENALVLDDDVISTGI